MKLSETMTSALLRLREAQESGEDRTATKKSPTIAALARRGLVEYGELAFGTSYRVLLTEAGRKVAEELRGEDDHDDETPMTVEESRAHFEAMGIEIIGPDQVTIH